MADLDVKPGSRVVYRDLLRNPRFRNLAGAMLTSSLGDWIGLFAIIALLEALLGTTSAAAFALSGIMVARVVPTLVLGPVAGVFVDRWDRKRTLIVTDVVRGVVMALIAVAGDVFQLVVATLVIELMSTLFIPAKDAVQPNLVRRDELVQANQLSLMLTYGTLPLGAGLFALFVGASGALLPDEGFLAGRGPEAIAIWINALTFFVSAVFIARIRDVGQPRRTAPAAAAESPGAWTELKQGFLFIASHPLIRALVVGVMGASVAAGVVVAVGKLFVSIVNAGTSGFGILGLAVGLGLFAGLAAAGPAARRVAKERLFAPGIGVAGGALIVASLMPRLDLAMLPAFVMGAGAGLSFVTGYTLLQERADDQIRGRTFAAFNTGVRAALFASLVVGPLIVGLIGLEGRNPVTGTYPYTIAGVRITLILGGLVAAGGAVWTGRAIHGALTGREQIGLTEAEAAPAARHGLFVAFEGGEGAGKSTQLRLLRAAVERAGHDVVTTREPGGSAIGERVRDVLLDRTSEGMSDRAEALLYAAARAQHAEEVIRPALGKGAVVLCDRFVDSSIVYQGIGRGLGDTQVAELNRWATADLQPDLVVLLDIDAVEGLRRAGEEPDRLEAAGMDFHRLVNDAYRRRAATDPTRYLVLDATLPAEELHARIRRAVLARLETRPLPSAAATVSGGEPT